MSTEVFATSMSGTIAIFRCGRAQAAQLSLLVDFKLGGRSFASVISHDLTWIQKEIAA